MYFCTGLIRPLLAFAHLEELMIRLMTLFTLVSVLASTYAFSQVRIAVLPVPKHGS